MYPTCCFQSHVKHFKSLWIKDCDSTSRSHIVPVWTIYGFIATRRALWKWHGPDMEALLYTLATYEKGTCYIYNQYTKIFILYDSMTMWLWLIMSMQGHSSQLKPPTWVLFLPFWVQQPTVHILYDTLVHIIHTRGMNNARAVDWDLLSVSGYPILRTHAACQGDCGPQPSSTIIALLNEVYIIHSKGQQMSRSDGQWP